MPATATAVTRAFRRASSWPVRTARRSEWRNRASTLCSDRGEVWGRVEYLFGVSLHPPSRAEIQTRTHDRDNQMTTTTTEVARELLELAKVYASECGECAGVGITPDDAPCIECEGVRDLIARAEAVLNPPAAQAQPDLRPGPCRAFLPTASDRDTCHLC